MSKFSKAPIKAPELVGKESEIKEFIQGALHKAEITKTSEGLPWDGLDDIEKTKGINLRITKADLAKLQHISKHTPYSIQAFCYEQVKVAIEEKLKELA